MVQMNFNLTQVAYRCYCIQIRSIFLKIYNFMQTMVPLASARIFNFFYDIERVDFVV